jgi:hypothetical protein
MIAADLLNSIEQHANAVTAVSTVLLAIITGIYAALAYLLLREQRRQVLEPRLSRGLVADSKGGLHLQVRNLGPGTAVNVALRAGPGRGLPGGLKIENLGSGIDLGAADDRSWPIKWDRLPVEPVRLVITYHDRDSKKIWFDVFEIQFADGGARTSAGWSDSLSVTKLKRMVLTNIPMRSLPLYVVKHWRDDFNDMLVEHQARRALAYALRTELEEMLAWGEQYEAVMEEL